MPCQSHKPGDECEDVCARSCYARKDGMSLTTDQKYWLDRRAQIIEALAAIGLEIWSDKDRVWLHRVRSAAPALEERATDGVALPAAFSTAQVRAMAEECGVTGTIAALYKFAVAAVALGVGEKEKP
jgi:hypothetical protein